MSNNSKTLYRILLTVTLASISIALSYLEIPWGAFLRLDFSEVIILFSLVILGFRYTGAVIVLKTLGRRIFKGFTLEGLFGESIALVACLSIVLGYYIVKKLLLKDKSKPLLFQKQEYNEDDIEITYHTSIKGLILYGVVITLILSIIMFLFNLLFSTPFYYSLFDSVSGRIHFFVFPYLKDSNMFPSFSSFLYFCIITYFPFNLVKGVSLSILFCLTLNRLPAVLGLSK